MRVHALILQIACAGLVALSAALPAGAAPDTPATVRVVTDGDPNAADDLVFTLAVAEGERLADLRLVEDGQEASLLGSFRVERLDAGNLRLRLQPALDFDRFKDVKAWLRARIEPATGGEARELQLRLAIDPVTRLTDTIQARLAVPPEADRIVPVLPLAAAGNARLTGIAQRNGAQTRPVAYNLATGPDGSPLAVVQELASFRLGEPLSFDLAWELAPAGKAAAQSLNLTPVALADLNRDLEAPLQLAPAKGQDRLAFSAGAAANLTVEDLRLLPPATPPGDKGPAPASVAQQFERSTTAEGDIRFDLKPDQTIAAPAQAGQILTLTVQKRLDGKSEVSQTVRIPVQSGAAQTQAQAANAFAQGALPGPAVRPGSLPTASPGIPLPASAPAFTPAAAPATPAAESAAHFPQPEPPGAAPKRRPRSANRFAAVGPLTQYQYDANGNRTQLIDPLGRATAYAYDALNRLADATDPAGGRTAYGYDALDQLAAVTDPRGLTTSTAVDGLGNLTSQVSPDTGATRSTYDAAGNLLSRTDAQGQTTAYAYDALNRVTQATYQDGSSAGYTYDQGANGAGRLSRIDERAPGGAIVRSLRYAYDPQGRVVADTRTIAGIDYVTAYRYDRGRLAGVAYPSGRSIDYSYDAAGRIAEVRLTDNGRTKLLAGAIRYRPFGGVAAYTNGAGQTIARRYDQDGRIVGVDLGPQSWQLTLDAASRITAQADAANPANTASYAYDALDRLTGAVLPGATLGYAYDAVGNRTRQTTGSASQDYTVAANSNRLLAVAGATPRTYSYDANGSVTGDGTRQFAYDAKGRLTQAILGAASQRYTVNALGQRVRKEGGGADTVFHYDLQGRLIAESAPDGSNIRDYVWLGDLPLAVVQ